MRHPDLGLLTLCGYAVNDILAWVIFSLLLATATQATFRLGSVALVLTFTTLFIALSLTLGLRLVDRAIGIIGRGQEESPASVLSFVCCLGLLWGAVTEWVGLTALLGFFVAGIMAGESQDKLVTMKPTLGTSSPGCHSTLATTRRLLSQLPA